ncbi:MAG TPA: hypothetical protein VMP67_09345 [Candidatus Limnocylindria bacterium]|nr:hypothetical protein [Candidatus Limnocylindria bacterium]
MSGHGRLHLRLPALRGLGRRLAAAALALCLAIGGLLAQQDDHARAQPALAPHIELSPSCGEPSTDFERPLMNITIRGHSFGPNTQLDVWHWDPDVDVAFPAAQPTTDEFGRFEASFEVRQPGGFGSYRVYVAQPDSDVVLAETFYVVPCPGTVSIDPPCADAPPAGAPLSINVSGQGWFAHSSLIVAFVGPSATYAQNQVSVENGSFSTTLLPPGLRAPPLTDGIYAVTLTPQAFDSGQAPEPVSLTIFTIPCAPAQVVATPDCGPPGAPPEIYDIDLSGTGFVPLASGRVPPIRTAPSGLVGYLEFIFDVNGIPQRFADAPAINADGSWGPVRIQPLRRNSGPITIRVRQILAPSYLVLERDVTFNLPCVDPTAAIQPRDCGPPAFEGGDPERRYGLRIVGQGFAPGPVEITFDAFGISEAGAELFPALAEPDGTLNATIRPLARPVGVYEIHVVQAGRLETILLQLTFRVPCEPRQPTLSLECDPEEPEPAEEAFVLLQSSGWFEQAPILLVIGGQPAETVQSDAAGTYGRRLAEAGLPPGPLEVLATQRDTLGTVVAEARALITLPCGTPEQPMLRVLPATVSPGFVVTVEGYSFPAGEAVNLTWDEGLRAGLLTPVTADETGTFRLQVLIFHSDFLGPREVSATAPSDPASALTEPAELLVVPGRGSPPAFVPPEGLTFEPDTRIVIRR